MKDYYVVLYSPEDEIGTTVSGMGLNKGTLDSSHTKRAAQKYAKQLSKQKDWRHFTFKVENNVAGEVFGQYKNGKRI